MASKQYMYGSAARSVEVMEPDSIKQSREERRRIREAQERKARRRQQAKADHNRSVVKLISIVCIVAAIAVAAVAYLSLFASIQVNSAEVTKLEQRLSKLTEQNNLMALELDTNIDYNEIYDVAINELGMVYPDKNQVVEYNSVTGEYVKQFRDIPE